VLPKPDDLATRIGDLSLPVLAASVAWASGDVSLLDGIRPTRCSYQGGLSHEERDDLARRTLEAVAGWDGDRRTLDVAELRAIMDWLAAEHVDDQHAAMLLEEIDLDQADPRRIHVGARRRDVLVAIIGCGVSGILAAIRLEQAGISYVVLEKNDDLGGTWLENTYPGARVDVPSQAYSFSFARHDFGHHYAQQPELLEYLRTLADRYGIRQHVRWDTEVTAARWHDDRHAWELDLRTPAGTERLDADAVICAVGQLNRPNVPDLPGLADFEGPAFHSARWDHGVDLTGARVALIGAGASGFQIAPAIAGDVAELVVFQRSAQWMAPNPIYQRPVADAVRWALRNVPGYAGWLRFVLLWQGGDVLDLARVEPGWPGVPLSVNPVSAQRRQELEAWLAHHAGDDEELLARVVPDYPPLGKRMLQDDGSWLQCLRRPNVTLVRDPIERIEADAVVAGGRRHEVDVIVLATGFRANDMLAPMAIVGRDGVELHDRWAGAPAAYLGITVPGFPNLFLLYGPGTNLAHGGSIIFHSECQMRYVGDCVRLLAEGAATVEPTEAAYDDYVTRLRAELSTYVWSHPAVRHSWYKADDGEVYVLSPWPLVEYWRMTEGAGPDAHVVTPVGSGGR
jgi:4-hydroxyacetophenone monooxygenase